MDKFFYIFPYIKEMNCDALENTAMKLQSKEIMENKIRDPFSRQLGYTDLLL